MTQVGTGVTIQAPTCSHTGTYGQDGQARTVAGTFSCTTGASGSITFYDLRPEVRGISRSPAARSARADGWHGHACARLMEACFSTPNERAHNATAATAGARSRTPTLLKWKALPSTGR